MSANKLDQINLNIMQGNVLRITCVYVHIQERIPRQLRMDFEVLSWPLFYDLKALLDDILNNILKKVFHKNPITKC